MIAKNVKPAAQLLRMWERINLVSFGILLLAVLVLFFMDIPLSFSLVILVVWLAGFLVTVIYLPAMFRNLAYSLTDDAVRLNKGVFWKRRTTVPYAKITNIDITQGPVERMFAVSTVHIQTAGSSVASGTTAELVMYGITDPESLKDEIMVRIHAPAVTESSTHEEPGDSDASLSAILSELKLIRKALEKS